MRKKDIGKRYIPVLLLSVLAVSFAACGSNFPEIPEPDAGELVTAAEDTPHIEVTPEPTEEPEPSEEPFTEPEVIFVHGLPEITGFDAEVCPGHIRYVSQIKDLRKNGWGRFEYRAGSECTTACISMALSCIGIDESPEKLLNYSTSTVFASNYGIKELVPSELTGAVPNAEKGYETLTVLLRSYLENRDWTVSPVLLYLTGNGNRHGILIIGTEDDSFLVLDPASRGLHRISISEKGEVSSQEGKDYLARYTNTGKVMAKISALAQWSIVPETETEESVAEADKK